MRAPIRSISPFISPSCSAHSPARICLNLQKPAQICIPPKKSQNEPKSHPDSHRAGSTMHHLASRNTNQHRATRRNNSTPICAEQTQGSIWHTYPKNAPHHLPPHPLSRYNHQQCEFRSTPSRRRQRPTRPAESRHASNQDASHARPSTGQFLFNP